MTPTELDTLFASMDAGDTVRNTVLEQLDQIHSCTETIRMDRDNGDAWKRIQAHQGPYWGGQRNLFHVEDGNLDSFEVSGNTISPRFRFRGYKGDGDSFDSVTIPLAWLTLSEDALLAALNAQFDGYLADARVGEARKAAAKEIEEKAQLAELLRKHGAPSAQQSEAPKETQ